MFSVFEGLIKSKGLKMSDVSRGADVPYSCLTDWKVGRYTPKADKIARIAEFLGVTPEYLTSGKDIEKTSTDGNAYYFTDETAQTAQTIFENPDLKILFDAARDSKPEDLLLAADLLRRLKGTANE